MAGQLEYYYHILHQNEHSLVGCFYRLCDHCAINKGRIPCEFMFHACREKYGFDNCFFKTPMYFANFRLPEIRHDKPTKTWYAG